MTNLDPADFNVITGAFKSVAAEMGDIMLRAAYSSIVREAKDCSTCVMDADAKTVAQAEMIPVHMNSLAAAIPYVREKYDIKSVKSTEAYVTNNPYENGQHLNDIIFILPVFFEDKLVAFTGSVCHHLELGGAVAGSNADATDLYQEGIIIPTMKIDIERDLGDGPVEQFIRANVRLPDTIIGDFRGRFLLSCAAGNFCRSSSRATCPAGPRLHEGNAGLFRTNVTSRHRRPSGWRVLRRRSVGLPDA